MKIGFEGQIEIDSKISGGYIVTEVSGSVDNPERLFYDLRELVGDNQLKQWLSWEGYEMNKKQTP